VPPSVVFFRDKSPLKAFEKAEANVALMWATTQPGGPTGRIHIALFITVGVG